MQNDTNGRQGNGGTVRGLAGRKRSRRGRPVMTMTAVREAESLMRWCHYCRKATLQDVLVPGDPAIRQCRSCSNVDHPRLLKAIVAEASGRTG